MRVTETPFCGCIWGRFVAVCISPFVAADDPLMLDKWFRAQAGSDLPDQVERVVSLQQHPSFTLKNPNRMRALLSVFTFNRPHFHRKDGAGYKLIGDAVLAVRLFEPPQLTETEGDRQRQRQRDV